MASVTLRGLTKRFDSGHAALQDLSLDVRDGEFLVLLGPSGCGKTTALRCVAGLEEPTAGEILIGDREVTRVPPAERDVAMVFQNYALYPHLSVRDNIAFPLTIRGVPKAELTRRVRAAAERLSVGELLDRRPAELSGGQRQRVALGRAIVREPSVFLFDEPLSNLDAQLRVEMRAEILRRLATECRENDYRKLLLITCAETYLPLEGEQEAEYLRLVNQVPPYREATQMILTTYDRLKAEGNAEGKREALQEMIVQLASPRCGEASESVLASLHQIEEVGRLQALVRLATTAESWEQLLTAK